jgi:hypothetical protein
MALIKCPECAKEISDTVSNCPHCGYAIKKPGPPTVIELTGKKWKKLTLVGWILIFLGFSVAVAGKSQEVPPALLPILIGGGIVILVYSKIMSWWHHK